MKTEFIAIHWNSTYYTISQEGFDGWTYNPKSIFNNTDPLIAGNSHVNKTPINSETLQIECYLLSLNAIFEC